MSSKKTFAELVQKMAAIEDGQLGKLRVGFAAFAAAASEPGEGTVTNTVTVSGNCSCSCTCSTAN